MKNFKSFKLNTKEIAKLHGGMVQQRKTKWNIPSTGESGNDVYNDTNGNEQHDANECLTFV